MGKPWVEIGGKSERGMEAQKPCWKAGITAVIGCCSCEYPTHTLHACKKVIHPYSKPWGVADRRVIAVDLK